MVSLDSVSVWLWPISKDLQFGQFDKFCVIPDEPEFFFNKLFHSEDEINVAIPKYKNRSEGTKNLPVASNAAPIRPTTSGPNLRRRHAPHASENNANAMKANVSGNR